jgi:hypothetical protein
MVLQGGCLQPFPQAVHMASSSATMKTYVWKEYSIEMFSQGCNEALHRKHRPAGNKSISTNAWASPAAAAASAAV